MASTTVINGVSIYNLAAGKSVPGWVSASKRKSLKKQEDFQRRLELLQDFAFPEASQTISVSPDGRYVVATGTYAPRVRVWDTAELSMKFERYMDSAPVAHAVLSADYAKLAFLHEDRNVEVHAAYGRHYRTRIPVAGRALAWHAPTAELLVACSGPEVYRLSLEEGRFMAPLALHRDAPAANRVAVHSVTALIGVACEGGGVELFDPRSSRAAGRVLVSPSSSSSSSGGGACDATALGFEEGGLGLVVGTSTGFCCLYDLRQAAPLHVKAHPYRTPVLHAAFHRGPAKTIISADAQQVKLWAREGGANVTTIETPARLNALTLASDAPGAVGSTDSGLLLGACEQDRMLAYYVPALGPAPRWASFLDALTEEVDGYGAGTSGAGAGAGSSGGSSVYDDYKFITREELSALGLSNLIGTPMLKSYMHGFFMDARLHSKVWGAADPSAALRWRSEKVKEEVAASRGTRVEVERELPAVNAGLALKLRREAAAEAAEAAEAAAAAAAGAGEGGEEGGSSGGGGRARGGGKKKRRSGGEEGAGGGAGGAGAASSILADARFSGLFKDPKFAIEEEEAEAQAQQRGKARPGKKPRPSRDEEEEEEE